MEPALHDDDESLRKRLLARVAVAGVAVAGLVAALTVFDRFSTQEEKAPSRVASRPIAPAPSASEAKPEGEKPAEEKLAATDDKAAPEAKPAPVERSEAPPPPVPASGNAEPVKPEPARPAAERPLTVPATPRQALMRPSEPAIAMPGRPQPDKEIARVLPPVEQKPAAAARPIARAIEAERQFVLQMGVFSNVANAEELRAKLELAGMPTQIEARVHVGPFATREDAEQAREKLKALGMAPGLLVAGRK